MDEFEKILDSSIWGTAYSQELVQTKNPYIRIGVVTEIQYAKSQEEIRDLVEIKDMGDGVSIWCRLMSRFGGVYNYEDYSIRGYQINPLNPTSTAYSAIPGDFVIVACLNGNNIEGVILGGLKHAGRSTELDSSIAYISEFNGVETKITEEGEYTLTYKGLPLNEPLLKLPVSGAPIPPPQYNPAITGSYMKFDKDGGWEINDQALALEQSIKVDKAGGTITLTSGQAVFSIEKNSQAFSIKGLTLNIEATQAIEMKTLEFSVDATTAIKLKGLQVAIGNDNVELFDQLVQLIDAVGKLQPQSPVGPCTPLMADPNWPTVLQIQTQLSTVKGSL